jgi:putative acetyltransferase
MAFTIRRLDIGAMDAAAVVHRAAFDDRLPWLSGLHTPDDDRDYFRRRVFADCAVWGAFAGGGLAGFIAFREGWIDQLYVLPGEQRRGVGRALLEVAKSNFPTLLLWTFQANEGARRFYEAHGFELAKLTDGAANEEREPDALYSWDRTPPDLPMGSRP